MYGAWGAVILAAGASQRMGTPKALLPWADTTLLGYTLHQAQSTGVTQIVVVLGPATRQLEPGLTANNNNVTVAFNPEPDTGRSTSIRLGCAAMPDDVVAVLIQSVDQPVGSAVLKALFEAVDGQLSDLAVPVFAGRRGHPVVFAGGVLHELRDVTEAGQGLRSVVRAHAARSIEVPVADESVLWNLNDPVAYAAARAAR
jgi:CTP:molybdopterin cytidylyltransferase MocA